MLPVSTTCPEKRNEENRMKPKRTCKSGCWLVALAFVCACTPAAAQSWQQLAPANPPPGSFGLSVFDQFTNQMLIFGGPGTGPATDVWALHANTNTWSMLAPVGGQPPAKYY